MSMKFDDEKPEVYAERMNIQTRLEKTEADIASIKVDIAFLKANSATKVDIAELKGELKATAAEIKSSIIMWVVGAIFIAQLLPSLLKLFVS